jgi:hypothetical protein
MLENYDSDEDYYAYWERRLSESEDDYDREPEEPIEDYRPAQDRNYPSNDVRW